MSIIERMVELLEPVGLSEPKPSAPDKALECSEADLIERAVTEDRLRTPSSERIEAVAGADARDPAVELRSKTAHSPSTTPRLLRIDPERLRRQNMITPDDKRTAIAECFRRIKRRIILNVSYPKPGTSPNLIMITSSVAGEGKTFCTINLALSIALERDHTVLLVDADVTSPSIPEALGIKVGRGWMDLLLDRGLNLADVLCETDIERLTLLPAGTPHPHVTELLASDAMGMVLQELSARDPNRIIIFDAPPLLAASEAAVLASKVGQVVVVVEAGKTTEAVLKNALGQFETSNVVGLILNKAEHRGLLSGYGNYGYGYDAK